MATPQPQKAGDGLNFWQWLGIALIAVVALYWVYENFLHDGPSRQDPTPPTPPTDVRPDVNPTRADAGPGGA